MKNSASGNENSSPTGEPSLPTDSDLPEDKKGDMDELFGETKKARDKEPESTPLEKSGGEKSSVSDDEKFFSNDKADEDLFISAGAGNDPWFGIDEGTKQSSNRPASSAVKSKKRGCWGIFTSLFFFASFIAGLILAAALLFVWVERESFEQKAKAQVESAIKESIDSSGLHLSFEKLIYQQARGFKAVNVTLFQSEKHEKPVLKLSDASFHIDFIQIARLLSQQNTNANLPRTIHWDDASLTLFDAEGKEVTKLTGLRGELLLEKDRIETDQLGLALGKLQINLSGQIRPPGEKDTPSIDFTFLNKILPWIDITSGKSATLDVRVDSDEKMITGNFRAGEIVWRKTPIRSASVPYQFDLSKNALTATDFHIGYGSGDLNGSLTIEVENKALILHKILSTVDPIDLASRFDPSLKEKFNRIELIDSPNLQITGNIPLNNPEKAICDIGLQHGGGLTFRLGDHKIPLQALRGHFKLNQGSIDTRDFAADLLGGSLRLNGAVNLENDTHPFNGLIEIDYLPLEVLSTFLGDGDVEYSGDLHLSFRGAGKNKITDLRGGGKLMIENGKPSRFPIVGPVQDVTASLVPALAPRDFGDLNASLLLESGVLVSNDITISGDSSKTVITGELNLETGETTFHSASTLVGIPAKILKLEGKALQLQGNGPVMKPHISVQDLPTEYAAKEVREVLHIPSDGAIAQAINQLSKDTKNGNPTAEGDASPATGNGEKASSVDESIMSIFRKSANDLKEILESVETPKIDQ